MGWDGGGAEASSGGLGQGLFSYSPGRTRSPSFDSF